MDLNSYVILKYSFFHRIIDMWNQLPFDIRYSDDVNIFKSRVKKCISDSYVFFLFINAFLEFIILSVFI